MLVIANNLSYRNRDFVKAANQGDTLTISAMAEVIKKAGADIINVNISLDGDGDDKVLPGAVEAVAKAGLPIFIDSRNPKAVWDSLDVAGRKPTVNYISAENVVRSAMDDILQAVADRDADVVLYPIRSGTPRDADERLANISELMERANDSGITNDRIIVDPVILHLGGGVGQEQAVHVQSVMLGINELIDPPVRTTCWISNASAGAPKELRPAINSTYLAMLAGLGLWSVFMGAHNREMMRAVRLIRALRNEAVYSPTDAAL